MSKITSQLSAALADRYKIESHLGEGGMAIVYLAQDIKHDRKVALKVLRPELAAVIGADRFLQEIKVTANLQHPHILPLHDSGDAGAFLFYVMPYVEGDSLRDKLNRERQFAIDEAVEITRSIASALDYAHRQGVIHRDIKPENILLHDGQAMVADFGIALAVSQASGTRLTETGLSIGTPHYMSPEQAMGDRELDARSDVYSLGAMLFEMLAGDPPYTGTTAQAVVAKVITEKAPLVTTARDTVPGHIASAISKALNKMPADRFTTAAAFADALTNPSFTIPAIAGPAEETLAAVAPSRRATTLAGIAAVVAVIAAFVLGRAFAPSELTRLARFTIAAPESLEITPGRCCGPSLALSPNGSQAVFLTTDGGTARRYLDQLASELIPVLEDGSIPFFSPDGRWIGFHKDGQLRKAPIGGGPSIPIAEIERADGASWGDNNVIVVGTPTRGDGLYTVPAAGGELVRVTMPDSGSGHRWPHMLPGGRATLFAIFNGDNEMTRIGVADLETGEIDTIGFGGHVEYGSGYLVHAGADGTLMTQPFDLGSRRTTGPAVALLEGIGLAGPDHPEFAISTNGGLVYLAGAGGGAREVLEIVTATGRLPVPLPDGRDLEAPAFSPDGRRIALRITDLGESQDIWVFDLEQGTLDRLTVAGNSNGAPMWTKDGRRIAFASNRAGQPNLYWKPFDGSGPAERILETSYAAFPASWLPDGRTLVFNASRGEDTGWDIGRVTVGDSTPTWILASEFSEHHAQVSPDGEWLAYTSNQSGENEVYVQALSGEGARYRISTTGATAPRWSPDGETLFYVSLDGTLIAASLETEPEVRVTERVERMSNVTDLNTQNVNYDVHPNGEDLLVINQSGEVSGGRIVWILNWPEIARRMGVGR